MTYTIHSISVQDNQTKVLLSIYNEKIAFIDLDSDGQFDHLQYKGDDIQEIQHESTDQDLLNDIYQSTQAYIESYKALAQAMTSNPKLDTYCRNHSMQGPNECMITDSNTDFKTDTFSASYSMMSMITQNEAFPDHALRFSGTFTLSGENSNSVQVSIEDTSAKTDLSSQSYAEELLLLAGNIFSNNFNESSVVENN